MAVVKGETSLTATLATMGVVYGIYQINMPTLADTRAAPAHNYG